MNDSQALQVFETLSHETRLKMLRALIQAGANGLPAGDIAAQVGASPPRASFHLASLTQAGLVTARREGRVIRYRTNFDRLGALMRYILHDCCKGHATVRACCLSTAETSEG